jgi:hypothetical protein
MNNDGPGCITPSLWQVLTLNEEYSFELASLFNSVGKENAQQDGRSATVTRSQSALHSCLRLHLRFAYASLARKMR